MDKTATAPHARIVQLCCALLCSGACFFFLFFFTFGSGPHTDFHAEARASEGRQGKARQGKETKFDARMLLRVLLRMLLLAARALSYHTACAKLVL